MAADDDRLVTLEGDDGRAYTARITGVTVFEGQKYAVLRELRVTSGDVLQEEVPNLIVRLNERNGTAFLERIDDDEEYGRVVEYVVEHVIELIRADEGDGRYGSVRQLK